MSKRIVSLIGNPNCGKTTLFNALTGSKQRVGNWPGVTVDKKTGDLSIENHDIELVDLPGIYSVTPTSGKTKSSPATIYCPAKAKWLSTSLMRLTSSATSTSPPNCSN